MMAFAVTQFFGQFGMHPMVESAGVSERMESFTVPKHSITILRNYGVDISKHRPTCIKDILSPGNDNDFDLIICTDQLKSEMLQSMYGVPAEIIVAIDAAPSPVQTEPLEAHEVCLKDIMFRVEYELKGVFSLAPEA
jgi:protein-tyrosine-phosphatase